MSGPSIAFRVESAHAAPEGTRVVLVAEGQEVSDPRGDRGSLRITVTVPAGKPVLVGGTAVLRLPDPTPAPSYDRDR